MLRNAWLSSEVYRIAGQDVHASWVRRCRRGSWGCQQLPRKLPQDVGRLSVSAVLALAAWGLLPAACARALQAALARWPCHAGADGRGTTSAHIAAAATLRANRSRNTAFNKPRLLQEARVNWAFQKEQKEEVANHFHVFVGDLSSGADGWTDATRLTLRLHGAWADQGCVQGLFWG